MADSVSSWEGRPGAPCELCGSSTVWTQYIDHRARRCLGRGCSGRTELERWPIPAAGGEGVALVIAMNTGRLHKPAKLTQGPDGVYGEATEGWRGWFVTAFHKSHDDERCCVAVACDDGIVRWAPADEVVRDGG